MKLDDPVGIFVLLISVVVIIQGVVFSKFRIVMAAVICIDIPAVGGNFHVCGTSLHHNDFLGFRLLFFLDLHGRVLLRGIRIWWSVSATQ